MTRQLSLWHGGAWHSGASGEHLHPAVGGSRAAGSVASLPVCLEGGVAPFWVGHDEMGCGNPLGAWHAPLSGTVISQLVCWHLWVTGKQDCAPRETGDGRSQGSPALGTRVCSREGSCF